MDGRSYSLDAFQEAKLLVVIFTCNHCPYAQALEQRFIDLQRDYAAKGVRLVAINSNDARTYPDDSFEHMRERAR
jgi:thiol-disulfide isomerase/thioredoxin